MVRRLLGKTGLELSPIGFGAFKIGRNINIKYPQGYELPEPDTVKKILYGVMENGINYIDTAPAYGLSEYYIGKFLSAYRKNLVISTKVGESFIEGKSLYDFSGKAVLESVLKSLKTLCTDYLDIVLIHSDGNDTDIIHKTDAVEKLQLLKDKGLIGFIGMSCKTRQGIEESMSWSDVLMLEYNQRHPENADLILDAARKGIGIVIKKGLDSGHLPAEKSIRFVLGHPGVTSLVIASNNLDHLKENICTAKSVKIGV
ncbi:MAG: aldo/keto reductase [bacterium]